MLAANGSSRSHEVHEDHETPAVQEDVVGFVILRGFVMSRRRRASHHR